MTDTESTIYERLRQRSSLLAWSWAFTEFCRLTFAAATFLGPGVVLVFVLFAKAQRSAGHAMRALGEWQLYAALLVIAGLSACFWKLAEHGSRKLLSVLRDDSA